MKKKQVKRTAKAAPKKNGQGKYARLRALLLGGKKTFTAEEMMQASRFDEQNLKTALTILRNPKRTPYRDLSKDELGELAGELIKYVEFSPTPILLGD